MASWNIPALVNKISEDVPAIKALLTALFKWTDADTTDVPVGAKRLQEVAGGRQMQEYSGSAWGNVGKLMHDVDMLDGKHASTAQTADTIPVRDANGVIPGNISGNAATATEASSLASTYTVPVANGGTGATTEAGARASLGADNASNISSGILDIAYGGTGSSQKNFVDLTSNQNVGGVKTFSSNIAFTCSPFLTRTLSGIANNDASRGATTDIMIAQILDSANKRFCGIEATAHTDGSRDIHFTMRKRDDSGWKDGFSFKELADGTVQHLVSTPPIAANDTQIATTAWVTTFCETTKKYLKKTGDALTGKLQCTAKYTNANTTYTSDLLTFNSENDNYGNNVALGGGGNTIVGGGESYANQLSALAGVSAEDTYICADGNIYLKPNCQTFANAKTITIDTAANMSGLATVTATKFSGPLTGNVTGNCSGSSGSCTGNAATATKATKDSANQQINTTYIKALSVSGKTITYTKGDGKTGTITTQDTTYSVATTSANGLMSKGDKSKLDGINAGAGKYTLFATWKGKAPNTTKSITGCVVGKPVLILYDTSNWSKASNLNDVLQNDRNIVYIKILSGAIPQYGWMNLGFLQFSDPIHHEELSLILIPTATTISLSLGSQMDGDDILYVYK